MDAVTASTRLNDDSKEYFPMSHMTDMLMKAWHFRHACKEFDPKKKVRVADFLYYSGRRPPVAQLFRF